MMGVLYGEEKTIFDVTELAWLDSSQFRRKSHGVTLDASKFEADADGRKIVPSGTVVGKAPGDTKFQEVVKGTAASLSLGSAASNNLIVFTARKTGAVWNNLSVVMTANGFDGAEETTVEYSEETKTLTINLANNGTDTITATAADVIAAVNTDPAASEVVKAENGTGSDGTGVVAEHAATNLEGGTDQNVPAMYITAEAVELTDGDAVVAVFDQARVRTARLATEIDDTIKAQLSGFTFV